MSVTVNWVQTGSVPKDSNACVFLKSESSGNLFAFPASGSCVGVSGEEPPRSLTGTLLRNDGYNLAPGAYRAVVYLNGPPTADGRDGPLLASDQSDKYFKLLENAPSGVISVTAPNGGEKWEIGVMNTITWAPYGYNPDINPPSQITAYLVHTNGKKERIIPSGKASIHWEGHVTWADYSDTDVHFPTPGQYYVEVVNNVTGAKDRSDAPFTLTARSVDLKLNGSDGPLTLDTNQPVTASWTANNVERCELHNAYPDASRQVQVGAVPNSGSRQVYLNHNFGPTLYCHRSDGSSRADGVQVNSQTVAARVQIESPNGGETIDHTRQMTINWSQMGLRMVSLALYRNDTFYGWIVKDLVSGDGRQLYSWVPNNVMPVIADSGAVYKIYATGQRADGNGYVDDKSDAPFRFASVVSTGALNFSTDPSTPAHQIIAAGSGGVTLAVYKMRATGEDVALQRVTLKLSAGSPADLRTVYLYDHANVLRGAATFVGNNLMATSTLSNGLSLSKDTDTRLIIKADISLVGTGQPGTPGHAVAVDFDGASGYGISSGNPITATGSTAVPGMRIFKTFPTVGLVPLPNDGLADGRLIRFKITADPRGSVQLGRFSFGMSCTSVTEGEVGLYAYTDPSYSQPIAARPGGLLGPGPSGCIPSSFNVAPIPPIDTSPPVVIAAGATYYLELRSSVSGVGSNSLALTTLLGDSSSASPILSSLGLVSGNFGWSGNSYTTSAYGDSDWTNGYMVPGLPAGGISQTRTGNAPAVPAPTVTMFGGWGNNNAVNGVLAATPVGAMVSLSWNSTNASSCALTSTSPVVINGATSGLIGNVNVPVNSTPITYTVTCTGTGGTANASIRVDHDPTAKQLPNPDGGDGGGANMNDAYANMAATLVALEQLLKKMQVSW